MHFTFDLNSFLLFQKFRYNKKYIYQQKFLQIYFLFIISEFLHIHTYNLFINLNLKNDVIRRAPCTV